MQPAPDDIVLVRGGGDIATGVVWRLHHAGFRVVVAELPQPLTIRRTVAVSSAVISGHIDIEGLAARRHQETTIWRVFSCGRDVVMTRRCKARLRTRTRPSARMCYQNHPLLRPLLMAYSLRALD